MAGTPLLVASLLAGALTAGGQVLQAQQQNRQISRQRSAAQEAERINQIQLRSVRANERERLVSSQAKQLAAINVLAASSGTLGGEGWQQLLRQNTTDATTDLASINTNAGRRSLASSTQFQAQDAALASRRQSGLGIALNGLMAGAQTGLGVYSAGSQIAASNAAAEQARAQAASIAPASSGATGYAGRASGGATYASPFDTGFAGRATGGSPF